MLDGGGFGVGLWDDISVVIRSRFSVSTIGGKGNWDLILGLSFKSDTRCRLLQQGGLTPKVPHVSEKQQQ